MPSTSNDRSLFAPTITTYADSSHIHPRGFDARPPDDVSALTLYHEPNFQSFWRMHATDGTSLREALTKFRQQMATIQTYWMRDFGSLTILGECILPDVPRDQKIAVASIGCSTGEEVYSLLFLNWANRHRFDLTGYDINPNVLKFASAGRYVEHRSELQSVIYGNLLERFPIEDGVLSTADNERKEYLELSVGDVAKRFAPFKQADILARPLEQKLDVIYLRYVMGHLSDEGQRVCAFHLRHSLKPGGILVMNAPQSNWEDRDRTFQILRDVGFEVRLTKDVLGANGEYYDDRTARIPK